jgi:hypothetical protein
MSSKIEYDVYRGNADRSLRLATLPGAGLPAHVKRKDWVLMPKGRSPVHSDAERDVAVQGYCFFQVVDGWCRDEEGQAQISLPKKRKCDRRCIGARMRERRLALNISQRLAVVDVWARSAGLAPQILPSNVLRENTDNKSASDALAIEIVQMQSAPSLHAKPEIAPLARQVTSRAYLRARPSQRRWLRLDGLALVEHGKVEGHPLRVVP